MISARFPTKEQILFKVIVMYHFHFDMKRSYSYILRNALSSVASFLFLIYFCEIIENILNLFNLFLK